MRQCVNFLTAIGLAAAQHAPCGANVRLSSGTLKSLSHWAWVEMRPQADTPASLFIYFRLTGSRATEALQRLGAMQADLRARHPGLTARLLARTDSQDSAEPTWMEVYEHAHGLSEAFLADLRAAVQALPAGLIGPRHTESFAEFRLPTGHAT